MYTCSRPHNVSTVLHIPPRRGVMSFTSLRTWPESPAWDQANWDHSQGSPPRTSQSRVTSQVTRHTFFPNWPPCFQSYLPPNMFPQCIQEHKWIQALPDLTLPSPLNQSQTSEISIYPGCQLEFFALWNVEDWLQLPHTVLWKVSCPLPGFCRVQSYFSFAYSPSTKLLFTLDIDSNRKLSPSLPWHHNRCGTWALSLISINTPKIQ